MKGTTRRKFLKASAFAGLGSMVSNGLLLSAPSILTSRQTASPPMGGTLVFRPDYVQAGNGPNLLEWAYASDLHWDAFHSDITVTREGVRISDTEGMGRFGINVRWNVEGFGYTFITADNNGEGYELPRAGKTETLDLNFELASSRVTRNRKRAALHRSNGWRPSREVSALLSLSEGCLDDARAAHARPATRGALAQQALFHALRAGELLELEHATYAIEARGRRKDFFVGCDSRALVEMDPDLFLDMFSQVFSYATLWFGWNGHENLEDFEATEGRRSYGQRDWIVGKLASRGITVEARPFFWAHKWVTPDWIRRKNLGDLKRYFEKLIPEAMNHYGEGMYAWEIVNELHDWANECQLTPEETIELTRFGCELAKAAQPKVHRLVNNCCPYAEYVQLKQWSGQDAKYRQRTPLQFTKDLVDAGVDFTIVAQQMYFPYRDLQDILLLIERYRGLGKPLHLSEVGASSGPTDLTVKTGKVKLPKEPYIWHRPWDEELQAEWAEAVYLLSYSQPHVTGAHWFDFVDPYHYIDSGGLLRSPKGEPKASYDRLLALTRRFSTLRDHS